MQKCVRCSEEKPESSFHQRGNRLFSHCIACGKTGTLKPPAKPSQMVDVGALVKKAKKFVKETRQAIVIFHDERGFLSLAPVNHLAGLHVSRNILFGYRFVKGKVVGGTLW